MEPRRLTAACQSCAVRAAMPFPLDCVDVLEFFTFAVLGIGNLACGFVPGGVASAPISPIVQRVGSAALAPCGIRPSVIPHYRPRVVQNIGLVRMADRKSTRL